MLMLMTFATCLYRETHLKLLFVHLFLKSLLINRKLFKGIKLRKAEVRKVRIYSEGHNYGINECFHLGEMTIFVNGNRNYGSTFESLNYLFRVIKSS